MRISSNKKNNTIAIDFTFLGYDELKAGIIKGSVGIFLSDILHGFTEIGMSNRFSLIINAEGKLFFKKYFPEYDTISAGGFISRCSNRYLRRFCSMRAIKSSGEYADTLSAHGIDKIWFPWMVPEEAVSGKFLYIGTCHDLKMRKANSDAAIQKMFDGAEHIVVLSEYVKQEIVNSYNVRVQDISVIPNAIALANENVPEQAVEKLKGRHFILDVNAFAYDKNTMTMLKAFRRIAEFENLSLVLCGGYMDGNYFRQCMNYIEEQNLSDRVFILCGIPEEQKNWLFRSCELFVTPSKNEGFGRTPIEAALCKRPVISARGTSLDEVTLGLLHYYDDPDDDEMLAYKIIEIIKQPDDTAKLEKLRDEFYSRYSPKTVARQYIDLFESLKWL